MLRLLSAPFFYCSFLSSLCIAAFCIFLFAVLTDIIDGIIARSLSATSRFGAYADVISDFIFIVTAFSVFIKIGWYYIWVLIPIAVSFFSFLLTSGKKAPIYDPFGKYMGAIMMFIIACTLIFPFQLVRTILAYSVLFIFILNTYLRLAYIKKQGCKIKTLPLENRLC